VYIGAVAVLAAAMQHGPTKPRITRFAALLGINRRTLVRWRQWRSSMFRASRFWDSLRALHAGGRRSDDAGVAAVTDEAARR
jgi:hypothetical protein